MKNIISLLRPTHWIKNLFIYLPLFFSAKFDDLNNISKLIPVFFIFSLTSSAVYVLNDLVDLKKDQQHPTKKNRPLASGKLSKNTALIVFTTILLLIITLMIWRNNLPLTTVIIFYLSQNIAYSFILKNIAIIDVVVISIGFVLRLFAGSVVLHIELSQWIVIMTFQIAMLLGFAKRRDDVLIYEKQGTISRLNITKYNLKFIDSVIIITAATTIVSYVMYTMSTEVMNRFGTEQLFFTAIFVFLGILRYLQIIFVEENSGNPTKSLIKDNFIKVAIISWILSFVFIIYF